MAIAADASRGTTMCQFVWKCAMTDRNSC
jgi:hypothetical protein